MTTSLKKLMLTLLVSIVICACKKDQSSENSSDNALENAKSWYLKQHSKSTTALSADNDNEKGIAQDVLWDKASLYTLEDGTEIVGAPLTLSLDNGQALKGSFLLLISRNNENYQSKVVYSDKADHFSNAIPEKEIGALLHNVPDKKVQARNSGAKLSSNKEKQMGGGGHQPGARLIDWYLITTYFDGNGNELYSTREYLYTDYYEPGDPQQEGNPGVVSRSQEINVDSLTLTNPCMVKIILKKLLENGSYAKLLQPFQTVILPGGTRLNVQGLPDLTYKATNQPYGGTAGIAFSLGETGRSAPTYDGMSSTIAFNSAAMANASQLFLQVAAIHEAAHAYANYYIKTGSYGYPVDNIKFSTWAMSIVDFGALANSQRNGGNFTDHSLFIENYVDNFVNILKSINGTSYTTKQYQMAAIYGLDNAGAVPPNVIVNGLNIYNIYKGMLDTSYSNLLTKFGLTASDIEAFYLDNLENVPAAKKLPTNCPN